MLIIMPGTVGFYILSTSVYTQTRRSNRDFVLVQPAQQSSPAHSIPKNNSYQPYVFRGKCKGPLDCTLAYLDRVENNSFSSQSEVTERKIATSQRLVAASKTSSIREHCSQV
jgi:hypothetical protein